MGYAVVVYLLMMAVAAGSLTALDLPSDALGWLILAILSAMWPMYAVGGLRHLILTIVRERTNERRRARL